MDASQIYILIAIVGLFLIGLALFIFSKKKMKPQMTPLTGIAFGFVIAGIIFDSRWLSYTLMGIGVLLAVIDMIIKLRKKKKR